MKSKLLPRLGLLLLLQPVLLSNSVPNKSKRASSLQFGPFTKRELPSLPIGRNNVVSRVQYDPEKWLSEPQMTISGAVMFDRTTGLSIKQCLEKCQQPEFQNPETRWICRSLTYDYKWSICDLFAIDGNSAPYFLSEYQNRDYFKYLAALPLNDKEFQRNSHNATTNLWPLTTPDPTTAPSIQLTTEKPKEEPLFNFGSSNLESGADGAKALASKQTGDLRALKHLDNINLEQSPIKEAGESKVDDAAEYHRRSLLKFSITPIVPSKVEMKMKLTSERPEIPNDEVTIELATEVTPAKVKSREVVELEERTVADSYNIVRKSAIDENVETRHKPADYVQVENEQTKVAEVTTKTSPVDNETNLRRNALEHQRNKTQGITTYTLQSTNSRVQKPNDDDCKSDEIVHYIKIKEHERVSKVAKKVNVEHLKDCADACTNETSFQCKSAVLTAYTCFMYTDSADHRVDSSLIKNDASTYLEQVCMPKQTMGDVKLISEAIRNYILVGQVQEVSDASTLKKCQTDCLTAFENLGFVCKSVMFYPTDVDAGQNCLLNSKDHHSKSDMFVREDAGVNMIYLAIDDESKESKKLSFDDRFQKKDSPIRRNDSDWTRWSKCPQRLSNDVRHRYLKCHNQKDVRKCPKQSAMCKPPSLQIHKLASLKDECHAVRSKGRKLCPHGFRYDARGIRHYCVHPIDC